MAELLLLRNFFFVVGMKCSTKARRSKRGSSSIGGMVEDVLEADLEDRGLLHPSSLFHREDRASALLVAARQTAVARTGERNLVLVD